MKGYKGFSKEMTCANGFKFDVGKTYTHDGNISLCNSGFHFCEHPLDVFGYYAPSDSVYAEVEAEDVSDKKDNDTKRVCGKIKIVKMLTVLEMTEAAVTMAKNKKTASGSSGAATASGDSGAATASGYNGAATASGDSGAATASGNNGAATASGYNGAATASGSRGAATASGSNGAATASGEDCVALTWGIDGRVKGAKGCYISAAEWIETPKGYELKTAKMAKVDGKRIKADTFYTLKNGKFVEVK